MKFMTPQLDAKAEKPTQQMVIPINKKQKEDANQNEFMNLDNWT